MCALKVLQIFEEVQKRHRLGQTNPAFEYDMSVEDDTAESGRATGNSTPSTVSPEQSPVL